MADSVEWLSQSDNKAFALLYYSRIVLKIGRARKKCRGNHE